MKSISFHYDQEKAMFFGPVQNRSAEGEQAAQQQMVGSFTLDLIYSQNFTAFAIFLQVQFSTIIWKK